MSFTLRLDVIEIEEQKSSEKSERFRMIGNEHFQNGDFYNALKFYNKAMCFAEKKEEIALLAGNRSAVYFELKMYEECVENTTIALRAYPRDKIAKIRERQSKSLIKLATNGLSDYQTESLKKAEDFIELSYPANPNIRSIANCLELKTDDVFGRGIYATRDLNPGDIIAIENARVCYVLDAHYERCCICMETNNLNLRFSDVDTTSMFCSLGCESQAKSHKIYLGRNPKKIDKILIDLNCPTDYLWKAIECNKKYEGGKKSIFDFNWNNLTGKRAHSETFLTCFMGLKSSTCHGETFRSHLESVLETNKMLVNFYDVRNDGEMTSQQAEFYLLFGSMLNHSCDPNIMRFEFSTSMVFYVAKPIKKGEQLFISYPVDSSFLGKNRKRRRSILKSEFHFDCQCNACKLNYSVSTETDFSKPKNVKDMTVEEVLKEFKENNEALKKDLAEYRNSEAQYLIHRNVRLMQFISSYVHLPF